MLGDGGRQARMKTSLSFQVFSQIVTECELMKEVNSSPRSGLQMDSTRNSLKCHRKGWQCVRKSLAAFQAFWVLQGALGALMKGQGSLLPGTTELTAWRWTSLDAGSSYSAPFRSGGKKWLASQDPSFQGNPTSGVSKPDSAVITLLEPPWGSLQFNPFIATTCGRPFHPTPSPRRFHGSDSF